MLTFHNHERAFLKIEGSATISRAEEIRNLIAEALVEVRHLEIAFDAWPTDLAVLQVLVSARRSTQARGGSFRLAEPPCGAGLDSLAAGGFLAPGCKDEIWQTEVKP